MKVYIIIKEDMDIFDDHYVYATKEIAEYYYKQLRSERFSYKIKELELLQA